MFFHDHKFLFLLLLLLLLLFLVIFVVGGFPCIDDAVIVVVGGGGRLLLRLRLTCAIAWNAERETSAENCLSICQSHLYHWIVINYCYSIFLSDPGVWGPMYGSGRLSDADRPCADLTD